MKRWVAIVVVAVAVFIDIAGADFLVLPPDALSTATISIAALVIFFPVAYWYVYRREGDTPF